MVTAAEARAIIDRAGLTGGEALLAALIGKLESSWGAGWTGDMKGSNNWGAITGTGDAGASQHKDSRPGNLAKGEPAVVEYTTSFARYSSPEEGARAIVRLVAKRWPRAIASASVGNLEGISRGLYGEPGKRYFTGTSQQDEVNIRRHAERLRQIAAEPKFQAAFGDLGRASGAAAVGAALLLTGAAVWWYRRFYG